MGHQDMFVGRSEVVRARERVWWRQGKRGEIGWKLDLAHSATTIERGLANGKDECTPAASETVPDGWLAASAHGGTQVLIGGNAGARLSRDGVRGRDGV